MNMETWTENWQQLYDEGLAKGQDPNTDEGFVNLGANFPNSVQGWYVPRYVVEGDADRGIKPMAPNLKSVMDLPEYWKLFRDPEDPSKGIFYSCIPGWSCALVNEKKFKAYGIEENYNIMQPGSGPALAGLHGNGLQAGENHGWDTTGRPPGCWESWTMYQLEEPPFDQKIWDTTKACSYPAVKCDIIVHKKLPEEAPDVVEMLIEIRDHPGYQQQVSGLHASGHQGEHGGSRPMVSEKLRRPVDPMGSLPTWSPRSSQP